MKIKSLMLGMLASLALVACTNDDVLEEIQPQESKQLEKVDASLTFSITSAASTRTVEGEAAGDAHGNADDSGHASAGEAKESEVKSVFVVFYNTDAASEDGYAGIRAFSDRNNSGVYTMNDAYEVKSIGTYKALVVVNPTTAIANMSAGNRNNALNIYNQLLSGSVNNVADITGDAGFMMTNKQEVEINVTATNNASNPANALIEVERVAAKVTYRTVMENNLYPVKAERYQYTVTPTNGWVLNSDGSYSYWENAFYPATTDEADINSRNDIFVAMLNSNTATYYKEGASYKGNINGNEVTASIMEPFTFDGTPIYKGTQSATSATEDFFVQLTGYALINQNNAAYYVRHTGTSAATAAPFGTLSTTNYLIEPNTAAKDAFAWDATKKTWDATFDGTTYYTNAWTAAKADASALTFATLPTGNGTDVTGDDAEYAITGASMGYLLENAMTANNQRMDMTTGIVFEAQMLDANKNAIPYMFRYGNSFYKDLESLNADIPNALAKNYSTQQYLDGVVTVEMLETIGITVYENGKCYYVTSQIKHMEDGNDSALGANEYIIMRNNIYSLAVTSLDGFGYSATTINGVEKVDVSAQESIYLTMEAKIIPWIVRFTNVEF